MGLHRFDRFQKRKRPRANARRSTRQESAFSGKGLCSSLNEMSAFSAIIVFKERRQLYFNHNTDRGHEVREVNHGGQTATND